MTDEERDALLDNGGRASSDSLYHCISLLLAG